MANTTPPTNKMADMFLQAGEFGMLPTNVRVFIESLFGRDTPVTAEDFSPEELEVIRTLADQSKDSQVGYTDYNYLPNGAYNTELDHTVLGPLMNTMITKLAPNWFEGVDTSPAGSVKTTLGQFGVDKSEDGTLNIYDKYDFSPTFDEEDVSVLSAIKDAITGEGESDRVLMAAMENLGVRYGPNELAKTGIPVSFALENSQIADFPERQKEVSPNEESYDDIGVDILHQEEFGPIGTQLVSMFMNDDNVSNSDVYSAGLDNLPECGGPISTNCKMDTPASGVTVIISDNDKNTISLLDDGAYSVWGDGLYYPSGQLKFDFNTGTQYNEDGTEAVPTPITDEEILAYQLENLDPNMVGALSIGPMPSKSKR